MLIPGNCWLKPNPLLSSKPVGPKFAPAPISKEGVKCPGGHKPEPRPELEPSFTPLPQPSPQLQPQS